MKTLDQLTTPAAIVDVAQMRRNIAQFPRYEALAPDGSLSSWPRFYGW